MDIPLGLDFPMDAETAEVATSTAPSDADDSDVQQKYRTMLSMWLSFCIVGFVWFVTKVLKGRQRIKCNFSSIEEQLKRMQAVIEERERAMAENANGSIHEDVPENSTKAREQTASEDNSANVDEAEATDLNRNELAEEAVDGTGAPRRRRFVDRPLDADDVELLRDTIEDIIQEGAKEVDAHSDEKDD